MTSLINRNLNSLSDLCYVAAGCSGYYNTGITYSIDVVWFYSKLPLDVELKLSTKSVQHCRPVSTGSLSFPLSDVILSQQHHGYRSGVSVFQQNMTRVVRSSFRLVRALATQLFQPIGVVFFTRTGFLQVCVTVYMSDLKRKLGNYKSYCPFKNVPFLMPVKLFGQY